MNLRDVALVVTFVSLASIFIVEIVALYKDLSK